MATTAIAGYAGTVTAASGGGTVPADISEWSATTDTELLDATSFDSSGFKEYVQGLQGCTGTAHGKALVAPARGACTLTLEAGGSGSFSITGSAIINDVSHSTPVDGLVEFDISFSYTGTFTLGTVA